MSNIESNSVKSNVLPKNSTIDDKIINSYCIHGRSEVVKIVENYDFQVSMDRLKRKLKYT